MNSLTCFQRVWWKCLKIKATFELKDNAVAVFKPKRSVPLAALESINKELERLENLGVSSPVDYSEWSTPTVNVKKKNSKIRVCATYSTGLDDSLKTLNYPLSCPENILANLNGGKFFGKIDLSDAYLQAEVDESCKKLFTMNTQ